MAKTQPSPKGIEAQEQAAFNEQLFHAQTADFTGFVKAVEKMRSFQTAYFKGRKTGDLQEAKRLERQVDKLVEDFNTPNIFSGETNR